MTVKCNQAFITLAAGRPVPRAGNTVQNYDILNTTQFLRYRLIFVVFH